ncbi:hypothetical protein B4923_20625 [Brenneria roseae subsp. americana]|uniref:Uncharacterized protein n=1 Tax=Brenneria roseae subsp. americana TaxID=1508507 RepID=A0A2U1TIH5_9GAMM|nr:Imm50 family immunity protein [Brenneria roseae]PWC09220.1 hypothetical protein B4923_20625 [Brenneria roseae subsp. americana]
MWFGHAIGKEKIQFMFDNELSIQHVEVGSFSLERFSDLKLHFFCNDIPKKIPEKWRGAGFNALSLVIVFGDVTQLNVVGSKVGFFCSPLINSSSDHSEITIKNSDLDFYCRSRFLTIESITPYIDERWD